MLTISDNQLKAQDITSVMANETAVAISVNEKICYVILSVEEYRHLRQREIEFAWMQARKDIEQGYFIEESAEAHFASLQTTLIQS